MYVANLTHLISNHFSFCKKDPFPDSLKIEFPNCLDEKVENAVSM